jgi:hypothetical protein
LEKIMVHERREARRRIPSTAYASHDEWLTRSQMSVCCKKRAVNGNASPLPNLTCGLF